MKSLLKYLLFLFLLIFICIVCLSVFGYLMEDRLVAASISQINKKINAKVNVQKVDVSLVKGFPYASVVLHHVDIKEGSLNTPPEFEPGLLSFEKVVLRMGLWGVFNNEYRIDELVLSNGWINLYFDNSSRGNFEIFHKSESSNNWLLELNTLTLDNVNFSYIDLRTGWIMKGLVDKGTVRGKFTSSHQSLSIKSKVKVGLIKQGSFHYLRNQIVEISTQLKIDDENLIFELGEARFAGSSFRLSGFMGRGIGSPISLKVNGNNIDSEFLLSFLSQYNLSLHPKTKTKGKIAFNFSISGYNKVDFPFTFRLDYSADKFSISLPNKPIISISKLSGSFTNGSQGNPESSELTLSFNKIISGESTLSGSLRLKDIFAPLFHVKINGTFNASSLNSWKLNAPFCSGIFTGEFEALGRLSKTENLQVSDFQNTKIITNLQFTGLSSSNFLGINLQNLSGSFDLKDRNITIPSVSGLINQSPFEASGGIQNAYALFFPKGKSNINATISLDSLNTSWFYNHKKDSTAQQDETDLWNRIRSASLNVFTNNLKYNDLICSATSFDVKLSQNSFFVNHFGGNSCNGYFSGQLSANKFSDEEYDILSEIKVSDVDVSMLFRSFGNFDQDIIRSENISGALSGNMAIKSTLKDWEIQTDNLESNISLRIDNGRLRDVEQLKGLSRFISLEELSDIKFETIENNVRIEDKTVFIPKIDINSSALNMSISGKHQFDGHYQYWVQLLLSDILFRKATSNKPENQEFGVVEDDNSGRTKLFLRIDGDPESYRVAYDRASARQDFMQSIKDEGKNLKEILKDEFNFLKRKEKTKPNDQDSTDNNGADTLLKPKKKTEKSQKFTIEWDDE